MNEKHLQIIVDILETERAFAEREQMEDLKSIESIIANLNDNKLSLIQIDKIIDYIEIEIQHIHHEFSLDVEEDEEETRLYAILKELHDMKINEV